MSSFSSGPNTSELEFVPAPIHGVANSNGFVGLASENNGDAFRVAPGFARAAALEAGYEAHGIEEEVWTAEQVKALEQAAFDRGVESATETNEACARVFAALELASHELDVAAATSVVANRELVLQLAIQIAERWVGAELSLDPALFANALDLAIENCDGKAGTTLFLSDEDHGALLSNESDRLENWQEHKAVVVKQDNTLSPGTFRLDGPNFLIDGTPDAIRDRLRDVLSSAFEASLPEVGE